jgi:galactokinase
MALKRSDLAELFHSRFHRPPRFIVRAPGRVNLIGEHTDYNDGFVLPLAIDRAIWIALEPREDRCVTVYSADFEQTGEFALDHLKHEQAGWLEYLKGVAWSLQDAGYALCGWQGVVQGDVPRGAGLSSSAALEVATARAFAAASGWDWDPVKMAKLSQRAENRWVGVNCGIMDQLISATGQSRHAVLIDCRSLELAPEPFPPGVAVAILDTATRRGLVDSEYNQRRACCEAAAKAFGVHALRDVDMARFDRESPRLDETTARRARHVISENQRTLAAADAMRHGDVRTLGRLMNESHESLRDDYEVSSEALNAMVEAARARPACYGARMTGAGFGGCAVALLEAASGDDFARRVAADYQQRTGHTPAVYVCQATNGAEVFGGDKTCGDLPSG